MQEQHEFAIQWSCCKRIEYKIFDPNLYLLQFIPLGLCKIWRRDPPQRDTEQQD